MPDFRHLDLHNANKLDDSRATIQGALSDALAGALTALADASIEEISAAGLLWATKLAPADSSCGLLMKLSAGLGLAASAHSGEPQAPPTVASTGQDLIGIWHSTRRGDSNGDHTIVLSGGHSRLLGKSLADPAGTRLRLHLEQHGDVVTGTWTEQLHTARTTHGIIRLTVDTDANRLTGQWIAHGRRFHTIGGEWQLTRTDRALSGGDLLAHRAP